MITDFLFEEGIEESVSPQLRDLQEWKDKCLSEKSNFLNWGFPELSSALRGAQGGDSILIASCPNYGKSQLQTCVVINVLRNNDDCIVLDFTMDDSKRKRITQYIANLSGLEMNAVDYANKLESEEERLKFSKAYSLLESMVREGRLNLYESSISDSDGRPIVQNTVDFISRKVHKEREDNPDKKIVICIDSLNDITNGKYSTDDFERSQSVSSELSSLITRTQSILLATSHLRKVSGRRPTMDDVKGNNFLAYSAKAIIGIHNDVKLNDKDARLYWLNEIHGDRLPIVEARFLKNKVASFNSTIFYRQIPALGRLIECNKEEIDTYNKAVRGNRKED